MICFERCSSLEQITIPSSVKSIGDGTFTACESLKQITFEIPSSLTSIEEDTFRSCSSLTQITIPSSVRSVGTNAFNHCTALTQITIPSSIDTKNLHLNQEVIIIST